MARNISEIPYTEIQERAEELARSPSKARKKIRGAIQDVYVREIPTKFDWKFLFVSSSLTTTAEHKIGTVSINTGDTSATFSDDAALTSGMTNRKIKISGNNTIYDFTFTDATGGTISPSFEGNANASGNSYTIFEPNYTLADDFDRFPKDGGMYKWEGGRKKIISEESYQEYIESFQQSPSTPDKLRLVGVDTLNRQRFEFRPAPKDSRNYGYDYIRELKPLTETSAGTISIDAKGTTVTGNTNCRFQEATTGDWLRVDAFGTSNDSLWYKIIAISHDSALTLNTTFANSGVTNAEYSISKAPELPVRLHPAVLWGAVRSLTLDQTDENFIAYNVKMAEVLSDSKRIHVSRVYSQDVTNISEDFLYRR